MGRNSDTGSFLLNRGLIPALSRHPVILSRHVTKREIDKRGWWGKRNAVQQEGVDFDGLPLARYLMEFRRISLATFLPWESIVYALDVVVIRDREMHSNLFCFFLYFPAFFFKLELDTYVARLIWDVHLDFWLCIVIEILVFGKLYFLYSCAARFISVNLVLL